MRVTKKNDIAFTPDSKSAIIALVRLRKDSFANIYKIERAIRDEYIKLTANSFGLIPADYYQLQKPENAKAMAKARLSVISGDDVAICKRFVEVVPNKSDYTISLCEEGEAVLEEANGNGSSHSSYSSRVSEYDINRVLEFVLGKKSIDNQELLDHNEDVKRSIKRGKYLKAVRKGNPLRAGLEDGRVCYEFTDAVFDDHIDMFTRVLFIGHQLRVVKDTDSPVYVVEKLTTNSVNPWRIVAFEDKLYDVIVGLSYKLHDRELRAVESAIRQCERGMPLIQDLFTQDEIRQLADAQCVELPEQTTFSVVKVGSESFGCVECSKVKPEANVIASGLKYEDADKLRGLSDRDATAKRRVENKVNRINNMREQLVQERAELVKLEEEQEQAESNLTNHQNQIHAA
jgi:hypothetical protein